MIILFSKLNEATHFPPLDEITLIYHRSPCLFYVFAFKKNMKCRYCNVYDSFPLLLVAFWPGIFLYILWIMFYRIKNCLIIIIIFTLLIFYYFFYKTFILFFVALYFYCLPSRNLRQVDRNINP